MSSDKSRPGEEKVLYSPILYHGSVSVTERGDRSTARRFSGTRLKAVVFPLLHRLIRHLPVELALLPARLVVVVAWLLYPWPGNPLRRSCTAISRLGNNDGTPGPRQIYAGYLKNALGAIRNFFLLYRHGADRVLPHIRMARADIEHIRRLIDAHGGIILAVPHNLGSAFSALLIGHTFDMLLVAKNSPSVERTRIAIDFYERMKLSLLMVRGGNVFEISRVLFAVLTQGKLVAATLDNIDRTEHAGTVTVFGQPVGLSVWAAKIASRMRVPIVPAYFSSDGPLIDVRVGTPLVSDDIPTCLRHYAKFFEAEILRDPASWAYLADKHWQKVLAQAVQAQTRA